jgi:hypothetical protein
VSKTPEPTLYERRFNDPEWTAYVMGQLWDNELVIKSENERYPKADGLRRIFHSVVGRIVSMERAVIQVPNPNFEKGDSGIATVKVIVKYLEGNEGPVYTYEEVADCYDGNTIQPFCLHATATASTMAEGRALRKIMNLKVLTIEEMSAPPKNNNSNRGNTSDIQPIKEHQKNTIKTICKNLGIKPQHVAKYICDKEKESDLTIEDGALIIGALSDWQISKDGKFSIPADFK